MVVAVVVVSMVVEVVVMIDVVVVVAVVVVVVVLLLIQTRSSCGLSAWETTFNSYLLLLPLLRGRAESFKWKTAQPRWKAIVYNC